MLKTIEGVYHQGRVDLLERPEGFKGDVPVIVTFLVEANGIDLRERGFTQSQVENLRERLTTFHQDWSDPAMDAYDERYARH